MTPRKKCVLALAAIFIGGPSLGTMIGHGPADAIPLPRHTITGFASTPLCDNNGGTPNPAVHWHFTSSNASGHTITSVAFNRSTYNTSHTADTADTYTHESPGRVSLRITATWEDGTTSSFVASTEMVEGICPEQVTTTVGAPTTVTNPTTTAPTFPPATTITPDVSTTAAPTVDSTPQITQASTPATVVRRVPVTPAAALPPTGAGSDVLIILGIALVVTGGLLVATRRRGVS